MKPRPKLRRAACLAGLGLAVAACAGPQAPETGASSARAILIAAAQGKVLSDAAPLGGSPYGSYLAGLFAGSQRDLAMAADFMLESLSYDPDNLQLLNRAFMLVAGDGRHGRAAELAARLTEVEAEHGLATLVLVVDAVDRGVHGEADRLLAGLPDRGLSTVTVPLLRGWLKVQGGDIEGALAALAPLEDKNGFGVFHGLHAALMNDVAGRAAEAQAGYDALVQEAGQPTLRLALLLGNYYERAGDLERARGIYEEFLDRNADSLLVDAELQRLDRGERPQPLVADSVAGIAEALFNLASLLSNERAEEVALIHTHLALRLAPDFVMARVLLGEILQSQDRGTEAIEVYRSVPDGSPFSWMVGLRVASELERLERTEEAVRELERLSAARPERYEPLLRLGNLMRTRERFAQAVAAYDRAVERVAQPERRHWTLFYFRGIAHERLKQWPQAERDFLHSLELEPEQPFVMNYLAYSWVDQKLNLDRAKGMLVRAVELRPDDGYIVDSLGWAYYRLGEYERGLKYLERAVELRPQDPVINDHLGDAYWRVGRHQEARFQWRRALSLEPEDDVAPVIERKIDQGLTDRPKDT